MPIASKRLIKGTIWSFIQRFGGLAISFISNMVLARLLCPEDFGTIGMVMVFVSFADVLVDGGLGNALIQKKDIAEDDLKTVFTANLIFSLLLYLLFYLIAPVIESYTEVKGLTSFLRVESVLILIRALYVVPFSLVNKQLQFKSLATINLLASTCSCIIAIILAYSGFGVWSLIYRNIFLDGILLLLLLIISKYKYKFGFNRHIFKGLFNFGFFVVLSNILENLYSNAISFFTGEKYSVKELGYYNQAYSLQQIPVYSMTQVVNQVLFPYFSQIQDDKEQLKIKLSYSIKLVSFCIVPVITYLFVYSREVITLIYSEKWLPCVPYFRLFCIAGCFNAAIHINRSMLKSLGRSFVIFCIQLMNTILGIALLFWGLSHSIKTAIVLFVVNTILLFVTTTLFSGKYIGYHSSTQTLDIISSVLFSVVAIAPSFLLSSLITTNFVLADLLIAFIIFILFYWGIHLLFHTKASALLIQVISVLK